MNVTCSFNSSHHESRTIDDMMNRNPHTLEKEYDSQIFNQGECHRKPTSTKWSLQWQLPASGFDYFKLIPSNQNLVSGITRRLFSSECVDYPGTLYRMFSFIELVNCVEETNVIRVDSALDMQFSYTRSIENQQGSSLSMQLGSYGITGGLESFKNLLKTDSQTSRLSSALHQYEQFHIVTRQCSLWEVQIDTDARPLFDSGFVNAVRALSWCVQTAVYNGSQEMSFSCARRFTLKYGLYYLEETTLGVKSTFVLASNRTLLSQNDLSVREKCLKRVSG